MTDDVVNDKDSEEESFADLFESYSRDMKDDVQIGDRITGEIVSIGKDSIFIDTGTKIDGVVDKVELLDENLELPYHVGDTVELFVVAHSGNEIRLSKALSGVGGLYHLKEAYEESVPIEGKVKDECKGGFNVEIMQRRAFCPISQMDLKYVENPKDYIGETFLFQITQFEENGRNIVVSRSLLLKQEVEEAKKQFLKDVVIGSQYEGRVTKLMPFGAFIELFPGVEGMVHLSEMSWSRVEKAEDVLATGDPVTVVLLGIEPGKKPGDLKTSLSMKQVTGDPWESVLDNFSIGDKIRGIVTRCARFGAFVEIAPGIEGLVHLSEMSYRKRVVKAEDIVAPGDRVEVMIKDIDTERRRVSLSIRDAEGDPWIDVPEKYKLGQSLVGTIEKKQKFGYFVVLEPGITGLLPKSKMADASQPSDIEKLREGDPITVIIHEIHPEDRKITLGPADSVNGDEWKTYAKGSENSMGSLGEKLQAALKGKID